MHITLNKDQKLSAFTLYENQNHFYIQANPKMLPYKRVLYISRLTGKVAETTQKQLFDSIKKERHKIQNFSLMLGKIVIQQQPYLVFCEQAKKVTFQKFSSIYQIKSVFIKKFKNEESILDQKNQKYLSYLRNQFFKDNFYFSYSTDITTSYKSKISSKSNSNYAKYFWNQDMLSMFTQIGLSNPWVIPIIQGHILSTDQQVGAVNLCQELDVQSNASNFVETEQIIYYQNLILSHLQLRGSCPIFWSQQNGFSGINYNKDQHDNYLALKRHYQSLQQQYTCTINSINLLSQQKTSEAELSTKFQYFYNKSQNKSNYFLYDFNKNIKINASLTQQEEVSHFICQYQKLVGQNNFDCLDVKTQRLIESQKYIARVNCLDCIDRTNVIMTRLSQRFIYRVFSLLNLKYNDSLIKEHLEVCSNLGNKISNIYCGTDSIAQHLTKKQEASYFFNINSTWKSLQRLFNSTMYDQVKQKCNQIVLTKNQGSKTKYFQDNIQNLILKTEDYCDYKQLTLTILTWNVGAISAQKFNNQQKLQFVKSAFSSQTNFSDIIFVTLQEMVQLNSYNVITNNSGSSQVIQLWTKHLKQIINEKAQGFHYKLYESKSLVGLALFIFIKQSLNPKLDIQSKINYSQFIQVKRGFNGVFGNKGSLISFIQYQDTYITIFCSHLAAGDQKIAQRTEDIRQIFSKIQNQPNLQRFLNKSDFVYFAGDLNFRLSMSDAQIRAIIYDHFKFKKEGSKINEGASIRQLLSQDQFYKYHFNKEGFLNKFIQKPITFLPTYKFVQDSVNYDTKRPPAWCDRILSKQMKQKTLNRRVYKNLQVRFSDHRPVIAQFDMLVKVQSKKRKMDLVNKYLGRQSLKGQRQSLKFSQRRVFRNTD